MKVERNEPCPCGSKKKYKKCCLATNSFNVSETNFDSRSIPVTSPEIEEAYDLVFDLVKDDNIEEAIAIVDSLVDQYPDDYLVNFMQGMCIIRLHEYPEDAIPFFERSIQANPFFAESYFNLGCVYRKNIELAKSVDCFKKVIEIVGKNDKLGRKARDEIKWLERTILNSSNLTLDEYLNQLRIYGDAFNALKKKNYEVAISLFQQVLDVEPGHVQSWGNMGLAYAYLGNKNMALDCFNKALMHDPDYEPSLLNRETVMKLNDGEKLGGITLDINYYRDFVNRISQNIFYTPTARPLDCSKAI